MKKVLIGSLSVLMLSGCSFAPEYVRPNLELPSTWGEVSVTQGLEIQWWKRFQDPVLDKLVEEALLHNKNIEIAMARVDQARAYLGYARSDMMPNIASSGSGYKARTSKDTMEYGLGSGLGAMQNILHQMDPKIPSAAPLSREGGVYNVALQAVWEIDLWGKFRNTHAAAREQLLATEAGQRGALLGIAAQTTLAYFNLRNYDLQLSIAERTLVTREEANKIYQARFDEGLISELDFLRAKTEVEAMRANVYTAQYKVATAETALMVLIGRSPREIYEASPERGSSIDNLPSVPQLPSGLPSELLERRPDILAQEAMLKAANFKIGVAKSAWFPSISLTGQLGNQSTDLDKIFSAGKDMWTYGANVALPIFTFGRINNNVKMSEAATREAVAVYGQTVQQAFQEVRDALVIQGKTAEIEKTLAVAVSNLRQASELARLRYENGYAGYMDVLDAERSLYDLEIQLANVKMGHLSAIVQVCMALGGGWTDTAAPAAATAGAVLPVKDAAAK